MIRNVLALIILLTLTLAVWSLWRQLDVSVRSVRVEGVLSPAEQEAIRDVVSRNLDRGILSLDVDDLVASIRDLSWPRAVAVRRVWPDTLVIRVDKESIVASWGDGGYLTSAGKVVQLADGVSRVPALDVSLSSPRRAMEVYQMLESRVNPAGFSIAKLEENPLGEWLMTFEGGMTVALGNEHLRERLERFLLAYERAFAARDESIEHVDLRYDHGLAVRWADEPAPAVGADSSPRSPGVGADSRPRPPGVGADSRPRFPDVGADSRPRFPGVGADSRPRFFAANNPRPGSRTGARSHTETSRTGVRSYTRSDRSNDENSPQSGLEYALR